MEEIVLTSDLGSRLVFKAENSVGDHFVLQINDLGYHLPSEAASGLIKFLKRIDKLKKSSE